MMAAEKITERIRNLEMTLTKEQATTYRKALAWVASHYQTKNKPNPTADVLNDNQKLYAVERIITGRSVELLPMLKLKQTAAAKEVIKKMEADAAA